MPDGLPEVPAEVLDGIGNAIEGVAAPEVTEPVVTTPETTATPEGTAQEEVATDAPDTSFTKLDPNALPEEVRPYYQSMLSDYTRKTQEAAPWRKLAEETGVSSPDEVRAAAELYAYLQNPENVRAFYAELGQHLGQAPEPATPAAPVAETPTFPELDDPSVAAIRQELDALKGQIAERDQAAQREQLQWALLGEMNRQEALLKEQHPDWEPEGEEWTALWNVAPAFDGDLIRAASMIEAAQNAGIARLLNGKAATATAEGVTVAAPSRIAVAAPTSDGALDPELRNETAAAMEFLRGVVNTSE